MKYTFVQDESCDWYIVPVEKLQEFLTWWDRCEDDEDFGFNPPPDWAQYCQEPGAISFDNYENLI